MNGPADQNRRGDRGVHGTGAQHIGGDPLEVLYEDNHLLVVNKPSGMATMGGTPSSKSLAHDVSEPTLHQLAGSYLKQKYNKPHGVYVGIVSRLDRMTSGVIVLARTSKAAARLNPQFSAESHASRKPSPHAAQKTYLAVVRANSITGDAIPPSGQWTDWIYKDDAAHRMRISDQPRPDAKPAELRYQLLHRSESPDDQARVLMVTLMTGRKHQIRAQLSHRGYPILGDRKYKSDVPWPVGIALHSWLLTIEHPVRREPMTFVCAPPPAWDRVIDPSVLKRLATSF